MNILVDILKGMMIGIANIIPGLSGGTIAVIMNIYNKLIDAIADIFKHPIKSLISIWKYILGIGIGLIIGIFVISFFLEKYSIPTTMLFVGLILGSLPVIFKEINKKTISQKDIISCALMFFIVVALPFLGLLGLSGNSTNPIILFLIGTLASATMVIPGVSGSMLLMVLGYYDKIVNLLKEMISFAKNFEFTNIFANFIILLPFAIGVIVGIIFIAKLIKYLFKNYKQTTMFAILGLVIASPISIISKLNFTGINIITILVSIITFGIGGYVAYLFSKVKE